MTAGAEPALRLNQQKKKRSKTETWPAGSRSADMSLHAALLGLSAVDDASRDGGF